MASSVKIVVRMKPNKQGHCPLAIRITKDGKSNYIYFGHNIDLKHWDKKNRIVRKSHPNATHLNNFLMSELSKVNKKLLELQTEHKDTSANHVKNEFKSPLASTSFFDLADEFLTELENNKKMARLSSDKARVYHVLKFTKTRQLTFQEINENFLKKFSSYLRKKDLSERSIVNNLVVIRTIYNRAIKRNIVDSKLYPFGAGKIQIKFPESNKVGLTFIEIRKIEELKNLTNSEKHARNVWLFSFYLAGIRVSDVIKIRWSDIYDGRIRYRMNKNAKYQSLLLPDKITPILDQYISEKLNENDFVFPEMKRANLKDAKDIYAKTKTATKQLNTELSKVAEKAEINKKLTMHIARHSFGNIAEDKIPIQILQKLYRHSSITTTMVYQASFINEATDKALGRVVNSEL